MARKSESLSQRLLHGLAESVSRFPWFYFYSLSLLAGLSVWYTVHGMKFSTSRNDLVGAGKKYHQQFLNYRQEFPGESDLVGVVESEDTEKNRQFVERLAPRLEAETNLFIDVFYKGDLKLMGPKALLFLPEPTLQDLLKTLRDYRPFVAQFSQATNLPSLVNLINRQFGAARRETTDRQDPLIKALPALERILRQAEQSLLRPGNAPSPGINALFDAGPEAEQKIYITFDQGRIYLVNARPRNESVSEAAVQRLRELVQQTRAEVPGVNAGVTGENVLECDEMSQSKADTTVATIVSLILCALIFIYGYHETARPLKATACLVAGLAYTLAFTTLAIGHLNILTITFVPMLIGLAIDFGVHLITRYEEELSRGRDPRQAMEKAMVFTGKGIFTGCFTTAAAFVAMGFTGFKGIQEMGIISGGGLLICLVPMMTLLPVLLRWKNRDITRPPLPLQIDRRARIEKYWLDRPWLVLAFALILSTLASTAMRRVYFDYNLLNLQSKGLPAVVLEQKLIHSTPKSLLYGAVVANSPEEAVRLEKIIEILPVVANVDSIASILTEKAEGKLEVIGEIKKIAASIHFPAMDLDPVNLSDLDYSLWVFKDFLSLALGEVQSSNEKELTSQLQSLRRAVLEFRHQITLGDRVQASTRLAAFQQALFRDLRETFETMRDQHNAEGLRVVDLPRAIKNRFVGKTGKYLLQVYPKKDVWQRENQEEFVRQLRRAVDPDDSGKTVVTGTPVQLYEYTSLLKKSYEEAAYYSLGAIVCLTLIHFRSVICVFLALLPVGIGTVWTVGIMGLSGVPFNPANIMMLPLVVGIGVTNGIHILNRFAEEQTPSILARSTGKAVIVSALTTVAGFGSLVLGKHQGIASLGFVMAVGTTTCLAAALTVLPAIIALLMRWGWQIKNPWQPSPFDGDPAETEARSAKEYPAVNPTNPS